MPSPRVSGARFDQLLQQAREPAFWLTAELKLVWVNRAWEELTGHPLNSVAGLVCRAHGPTRAGDLPGLGGSFYPPAEALAGCPAAAKTLIVHASGERRWRRVEYWPFHTEAGDKFALLGLVRPLDDPPLAPDSGAQRLRAELLEVRDRLLGRYGLDNLIGRGPAHRRLLDQVAAAAASTVPVLIVGEPGTGKRLVARTIHQLGSRNPAPIVPLDCAALPPDVLERTLFGPVGGDGEPSVLPRLALTDGSTLLIGDILDVPRDLQSRLANALDTRTRLIATTTTDPDVALASERLRCDLYYTLTTLVIRLSPLRDRLDELPLLAQHILERANLRGGRQRSGFSDEVLRTLLGYDWPGNLRELARVLDEAHGRGEGDAIEVDDLPAAIRGHLGAAYAPPVPPPPHTPHDELLTQVERRLIENALQRSRQNKSRAAELLGISRPRLYRRIRELNLLDEPEPAEEVPIAPDARA
jgi:transcriptional regulator with AAA-type ATPase domain